MKTTIIDGVIRSINMTNEKFFHIYKDMEDVMKSFERDSNNPLKKDFIESAIDNNCTAYNSNWNKGEILVTKEALIEMLLNLPEKDITEIFDRVIDPTKHNKTNDEIKTKTLYKERDRKNRRTEKPDKIFAPDLIILKSNLIICNNKKFSSIVTDNFMTKFNLYKEGERLRLIVYKNNDLKKENHIPTNFLFNEFGEIFLNNKLLNINDEKYFAKNKDEYNISLAGIKIPLKNIFGRGFVDNNKIFFYYKDGNPANNLPSNLIAGRKF